MTSFISGPILQVQLDSSSKFQDLTDSITYWTVEDILNIDSDNDQNIHWARGLAFSVLLDPNWVQGLDINAIKDIHQIKLKRTFDFESSTESWCVL